MNSLMHSVVGTPQARPGEHLRRAGRAPQLSIRLRIDHALEASSEPLIA